MHFEMNHASTTSAQSKRGSIKRDILKVKLRLLNGNLRLNALTCYATPSVTSEARIYFTLV